MALFADFDRFDVAITSTIVLLLVAVYWLTNRNMSAERRFARRVRECRRTGYVMFAGAIAMFCLGVALAVAGDLQGVLFAIGAIAFGYAGLRMTRTPRRPHWLEIAVLNEQRRSPEKDGEQNPKTPA